jgi:hypothetical protein
MVSIPRITRALLAALLLSLLATLTTSGVVRQTPQEINGLQTAWARTREAGAYRFVANVEQTLIPRATPETIGQTDQRVDMQIEGAVTLPDKASLKLQFEGAGLNAQPATLIQEGSQTYILQNGERTPLDNPLGLTSPTPDYLGYLAAAKNVHRLDPPPAATESAESPNGITRYAFDIDGPRFAQHVLNQMEDSQQIPPGARLAPSSLLQRMSGSGELWVDTNGLPLRQVLDLNMPQASDEYDAQVHLVVDFYFEPDSAIAEVGQTPGANAGVQPSLYMSPIDAVCLLACLALVCVLVRRQRRWVYGMVAISASVIMLATPLLQVLGISQFRERQAHAAGAETLTKALGLPQPATDASQQAETQPQLPQVTFKCGDGVPGEDSDDDGLQDVTEFCLGTDPFYFDSDRDMITDTLEAVGFDFGGKHWPGDPFKVDANSDGLPDVTEWPAPVGQAPSWDPDGDTIPNLWDWDNDGDDVPDALDLSPFSNTDFADQFSFSSRGDGFDGYQYIEIQVRPKNEDHLRYTTTPLDWPYDYLGQIRDYDDSPDDIRLIPVLDVLANRVPNAFLAEKYGLTVLKNTGNEKYPYRLIIPVFPVGDGGKLVTFSTKVAYSPEDLYDIQWAEGRLLWIVQMDADRQVNGQVKTETMPIQTYTEQISITGLQVTKSRNFESAILGTPDHPDDDRELFNLLFGLSNIYLNTHTLTLADVKARFESSSTDPVEKWGVAADVAIDLPDTAYAHRDAGLAGTSSRIDEFLDLHYSGAANPALITAYQEETGAYNLDDLGQVHPEADIGVHLSSINLNTVRGLKHSIYTQVSAGWEELDMARTLQAIHDRYTDDLPAILATLQTEYPNLTTDDLQAALNLFYSSWSTGQSQIVAVDGTPIPLSGQTDADVYAQLALPAVQALPVYMLEVADLTQSGGGLSVGGDSGQIYAYLHAYEQESESLGLYGSAFFYFVGKETPFKDTGNFVTKTGMKAVSVFLAAKTVLQTTKWATSVGSWTGKMNILKNGQAGSRVLGALGCVLTVSMIWGQFGMTTDFSDPVALKTAIVYAVISSIFAIVMFVISLNPIGSILVMIFALADLIVFAATEGEISVQQTIIEALVAYFYSADLLTAPEDADFINFATEKPPGGLIAGSRLKITEEYVGKIASQSSHAPGLFGEGVTIEGTYQDLQDSTTYGWKDGSYTYYRGNFVGDFPTVEGATKIGDSTCTISGGVKTCRNDTEVEFTLVAHRDLDLELQPNLYFRTYYQESTLGGTIGWRKESELTLPNEDSPIDSTAYVVDVLPNNLTALWSWTAIRNPDDDGDGLPDDQESATWDDMWDTDCDGLSDKFERDMQDTLGFSPTKFDRDLVASSLGEDLNDGFEYHIGTRPDVADTDGDGLFDYEEIYHQWQHNYNSFGTCRNSGYGTPWSGGWQVNLPGTSEVIWVSSDPLVADADGDGLNDASERENGTSPFAYNEAPRLNLEASPTATLSDGTQAVYVEPGDTVALTVTLSSVGPQPITSTLELCLPGFLTDVQGSTMTGDRTPAVQPAASCANGLAWSFAQANTLQLWEQATATVVATVAPTGASTSTLAAASLPYAVYGDAAPIVDSVAITVDIDEPQVGIAAPANGATLGGGITTYVVGGWAEDATSEVTRVDLDLPAGGGTITAEGTSPWAYAWTLPTDGVYILNARAYDVLGHASDPGAIAATATITVDNTAPTVTFPLADGSILPKQEGITITVELSGSADDNLSGLSRVLISLDDRPWREVWAEEGSPTSADWSLIWRFPNAASAQGEHTVAIKAYDLAGNESAEEKRALLIDVLPPTSDLTRRTDPSAPLHVQVGTPVTFTGIANDVGNAPLPPHPAQLAGTLDSITDATVWLGLSSIEENDAGVQVTWLGDFNGDRLADLAVGLPGAPPNGSVTIIYGRAGGWPVPPGAEALVSSRTSFAGQSAGSIGGSIAAVGDVNGDGFDDLLVGDTLHNRVFLIYGRPATLGRGLTLDGPRPGSWTVFEPPAGKFVGQWLGSARDVNGDGLADILIGATGTTGATYLVLGQVVPWGGTTALETHAAAEISTGATGAYVAGVGDMDGDHYDEFAVAQGGTVYVFDGQASFTPRAGQALALADADHAYASTTVRPQVVALGDVDDDDRADFIYQSSDQPQLIYGNGSVKAFSGLTPAPSGFLAAVGDVDADGRDDILIGNADDNAYLILGQNVNAVAATLTGVEAAASTPYAAGADLNSDGSSDLLLVPHETTAADHGMDGAAFGIPHVDASALPVAAPAASPETPAPLDLAATTLYVDDDYCNGCANDGHTWGVDAFGTIQSAISAAASDDTISVNPGVYASFSVSKSNLTISGVDPDAVFVDGQAGSYAIRVSNAVGVRLEKMTLRNATYGVYLEQAGVGGYTAPDNVTVLNTLLIVDYADHAVYMDRASTARLRRCTLAGGDDHIQVYGGADSGVDTEWGPWVVAHPLATDAGGGIFSAGGTLYGIPGGGSGQVKTYDFDSSDWVNYGTAPRGFGAGSAFTADESDRLWALRGDDFLGGFNGTVYAIVRVSESEVYVGGDFTQAGDASISYLARWNGSAWVSVGSGGTPPNGPVYALAVSGAHVYAGGSFGVRQWDGTTWNNLGNLNAGAGGVYALLVDGTTVYAGGDFTHIGGQRFYNIAKWDGATWDGAGCGSCANPNLTVYGPDAPVYALATSGDRLYVGGDWEYILDGAPSGIWDPNFTQIIKSSNSWSQVGGTLYGTVYALRVVGSYLFIGGDIPSVQDAGSNYLNYQNLVVFDTTGVGTWWVPDYPTLPSFLDPGTDGPVRAIDYIEDGSDKWVYIAGDFASVNGVSADRVARLDWVEGSTSGTWSALGGGASGQVNAIATGWSPAYSTAVYVGGVFTQTGSTPTSRFALWDTSNTRWTGQVFYRYNGTTWASRQPLPTAIGTGAAIVSDRAGHLYALAGKGSRAFYRYTISSNTWEQMADAPGDVGDGSALVWASGAIYAARGGGTAGFYRYDPGSDAWTTLQTPAGGTVFGAGAGLAWDGNDWIFAILGDGGSHFQRYRISTDQWLVLGDGSSATTNDDDTPTAVNAGGGLAYMDYYESLFAVPGGGLDQMWYYQTYMLDPVKLTLNHVAFVAPETAANRTWINLDPAAPPSDFVIDDQGNSAWVAGSTTNWTPTPSNIPISVTDAQLLDPVHDVYRVGAGSALSAGYHTYQPDATVSPTGGGDDFISIQEAIDSGANHVLIEPGVYREAFYLVSGVEVRGTNAGLTFIEPPSGGAPALVTAEGVAGATLSHVTLAGDGATDGLDVEGDAQAVTFARGIVRDTATGIRVRDQQTELAVINDTIVGNLNGMVCVDAPVDVRNTVFAYNSETGLTYNPAASPINHFYNAYWANTTDLSPASPSPGEIFLDPLFTDRATHDYRPLDGSPLIDAGDPADPVPPGTGGRVDIGYVEQGQAAVYADDDYCATCPNDGLTWGVDAFASIQDALGQAEETLLALGSALPADGFTVGVGPGTYTETVTVPSYVHLVSSGAEETIITANGTGSPVTFDGAVQAEVRDLTLTGAGSDNAGVLVTGSSNTILITRNILRDNTNGVRFDSQSSGMVTFDTIVDNTNNGVVSRGSGTWIIVRNNILVGNQYGLHTRYSGLILNDYNLFYDNAGGHHYDEASTGLVMAAHEFVAAPGFADAASDDYRLTATSPAVDAASPGASAPVGGGDRADLGYHELLAAPVTLFLGQENVSTASASAGVASVEVGLVHVTDPTQPVTATLPSTWNAVPLISPNATASYWETSFTPGTEGLYRVCSRATDAAGNQESNDLVWYEGAFIADGTAPSVTMLTPTDGSSVTGPVELRAQVSDYAGGSFSVEDIQFVINGSEYPAEWAAEPWDPGSSQPRVFRAWVPLPTSSPYVVTAVAQDRAGNVGQSSAVTFGVSAQTAADSTPPSLTVDTPAAGSCAIDTVTFAGTATDAGSGLASVEVSVDGGITWMPAHVSGPNWNLDWEVPTNTDYVSYPAQVRASDRAGNTTASVKIVTADNAYPGGLTPVSFSAPQGSHFDAPTTLSIGWNPPLDGSGQASVRLAVDQATDTIPTQVATGSSAIANLDSAGAWYVHLTAVDGAGNGLTRHYGPWYVGTFGASGVPFASREQSIQIDGFIDIENDEWLEATEFLDDGESAPSGHGRQSFYATWDGSAFYLAWQGAWWTVDGTMWAYLDTGPGGTNQPAEAVQGVTTLPFDADYAVMVTGHSSSDGALRAFDGSTWQTQTLAFAHGPSGGTEVRIPLDTGSISMMRLVAFAVDDDGWVWSVFPTTNSSSAPADLPADMVLDVAPAITWSDVYQWDDLAGTSAPGDGQPENASVTMALGSPQASGTAWGPGDTLTYTLDLSNLEGDSSVNDLIVGLSANTGLTYQTVSGATCADCSSGDSWQLSVPTLPAEGSQHITVTAELASAATLGSLQSVTTTVTLEWNASTLAQGSLAHRVDGQAPTVAVTHLPGQVLAPGLQTVYGTADDGDGAGVGNVQYREPGGPWQAATGTSLWSMDVNAPTLPAWQIEVQAYDVYSQASQPLSVTFVVDTIPPTLTLDLPPTLNGDYATIGGTTSDPYPTYGRVAGASVQIDSETAAWRPAIVYPTGAQMWRFTWDLPNEDGITHTVHAHAIDAAKNASLPTDWQTVLVDTVAPVMTATQVLTQVDWTDYRPGTLTGTVVFTGTASDGGGLKAISVRVYAPTGESYVETADLDAGAWSYVPTLHTGGLHRLYILAEDVAGNVSVRGPFELHGGALTTYLPLVVSGYSPTCEDVFEPDDMAEDASVIAADGTPQQHNFHQAGDVDWVAFDVPDSSVDYAIETSDLAASTDTVIYVYDSDQQRLLDWNDDAGPGKHASYLYFNPYHTGRYYIKIVQFDASAGSCDASYAIHVTAQ